MTGNRTPEAATLVAGPPGHVNGLPVIASRGKPTHPGELPAQYWVICRRLGQETARPYIVWIVAYDPCYQGGSWVAGNGRYDLTLARARQVLAERAGAAPQAATAGVPADERHARAVLTWLAGLGDLALGALIRTVGPVQALASIRAGQLPAGTVAASGQHGGILVRHLDRWRSRLDRIPGAGELAGLEHDGIRLVCPGDPDWPPRLDDLGDVRPVALWLRGTADLSAVTGRSVSMVGSRTATGYGVHVAGELAGDLAEQGWTIVSGGAYGIDAAVHRGALTARGTTIVVLACGVDHAYPAGHDSLFTAITGSGLIISELPPGSHPTRLRFLVRNRVIAALTDGTVVIEAGERSGALNTARHAAELNRPLMAVPGPVTSAQSAGCHRIIRDWNGMLVTSTEDVLSRLTATRPALNPASGKPGAP